ncbi:non-hydrolyzing UDP-N-acetylglucosamine 2-epimerase [Rhodanobacter glycinis]|uniref:UDP-GlcNAc3NAcA epimerase n=1 Tax=Rhodanobacter glycinis TaxID=582702 RepID=A0A1I4A0B9_9GAMM|nr:UDP-N-acetylglucosamine 2-epimerase (non-hydrolyzing) [Rhodanobacter glycinis]SFK49795.1 UDP-GlcNAc3NAcA epimerase [Rhodanobacter glycinis]
MRVVTVLGARPQFIKASVVSAAMLQHEDMHEVVVHTGQHFDANMSDVFFAELGMASPAYHLDIHGGQHGEMTGRMLQGIERVLLDEKPDAMLVYGDTNSTLAGALAAAKLHIPVAHVEAGLRSFNMRMPEEVNRILVDRISSWLFAPTDEGVVQLQREGIDAARIHQVGDVMYDVALHHGERAKRMKVSAVERLGLQNRGYVLVTVHRAENTDDPHRLQAIVDAFIEVGRQLPVVWPLHPRTRGMLAKAGLLSSLERAVRLVEPLGYMEMVQLEQSAAVIATDSGGVQKEAFFHRVPCVTLRDETEWVELVSGGWNRLAPPNNASQVAIAVLEARGRAGDSIQPYGDGHAAAKIVTGLAAL